MADIDFRVLDLGTVWRIRAVSKEAKDLVAGLDIEPWQLWGHDLITDWRPAAAICQQLRDDGFSFTATSESARNLIEQGRAWI